MLRLRGTGGKALTRVGMVKGPSETRCGAGPHAALLAIPRRSQLHH